MIKLVLQLILFCFAIAKPISPPDQRFVNILSKKLPIFHQIDQDFELPLHIRTFDLPDTAFNDLLEGPPKLKISLISQPYAGFDENQHSWFGLWNRNTVEFNQLIEYDLNQLWDLNSDRGLKYTLSIPKDSFHMTERKKVKIQISQKKGRFGWRKLCASEWFDLVPTGWFSQKTPFVQIMKWFPNDVKENIQEEEKNSVDGWELDDFTFSFLFSSSRDAKLKFSPFIAENGQLANHEIETKVTKDTVHEITFENLMPHGNYYIEIYQVLFFGFRTKLLKRTEVVHFPEFLDEQELEVNKPLIDQPVDDVKERFDDEEQAVSVAGPDNLGEDFEPNEVEGSPKVFYDVDMTEDQGEKYHYINVIRENQAEMEVKDEQVDPSEESEFKEEQPNLVKEDDEQEEFLEVEPQEEHVEQLDQTNQKEETQLAEEEVPQEVEHVEDVKQDEFGNDYQNQPLYVVKEEHPTSFEQSAGLGNEDINQGNQLVTYEEPKKVKRKKTNPFKKLGCKIRKGFSSCFGQGQNQVVEF